LEQPTDGELLGKVASDSSQASFEEVVRRHAGMVYAECCRLLADAHDAEDAAQAVFLVLWKKARSLHRKATAAAWLHRVACHVCRNAQRARNVRKIHERHAAELKQQSTSGNSSGAVEMNDVLDEELERLPEKYRLPLLLFHLEGRSIEEIAALINLTISTVGTRLSRGREILRNRIVRRGIVMSTATSMAAFSAAATAATLPPTFVAAAAQSAGLFAAGQLAAGGVLSPQAAALAKGAIHMLTVAKLRLAIAGIVLASLACCGTVAIIVVMQAPERSPQQRRNFKSAFGERTIAQQPTVLLKRDALPKTGATDDEPNQLAQDRRSAATGRKEDDASPKSAVVIGQGHSRGAAAGEPVAGPLITPKEILATMRQRENAIRSFEFKWRSDSRLDGRFSDRLATGPDAGKHFGGDRPLDRLLITGTKCRFETTMIGTQRPCIHAFNGHVVQDYIPGPHGSLVIREAEASDEDTLSNVNLLALAMLLRPLSQDAIPLETGSLAVEQGESEENGRHCVVLTIRNPRCPDTDEWRCFLDRERNFVPVRLQWQRGGHLLTKIRIPRFRIDPQCGPVPTMWLTSLYRPDGTIFMEYSNVVDEFHINREIPDSEFELTIPPGITVLRTKRGPPKVKPAPGPQPRNEPIYKPRADAKAEIAAALEVAKREHKKVLIRFGGNWCGWCYLLHDVFTKNEQVAAILKKGFVLVLVDIDTNKKLFESYVKADERRGFPHLTVLDADGNVLKNQETDVLENGPEYNVAKVKAFLVQWLPSK
jgi:RNA polymerase sigma factor (sigma-70 family)